MARGQRYDLVILGGGTGGLVSALIAAGMGARVALVEPGHPGGDCLWTGCVPSKALLAAAELVHGIRHAERFGVRASVEPVDLAAVMAHVRDVQQQIAPHDSVERLQGEGVQVIPETGRFVGRGRRQTIQAGDRLLRFRSAIIATGSHPVLPPIPGLAAARPLTTETIWDLQELPASLAVIGGGPIGCELGQAFARLGSKVTILDTADRLLPRDEPPAGRRLAEVLTEEGIDVRLSTTISRVDAAGDGGAVLQLVDGPLAVDRVLVAAGRVPRTGRLGLEVAGVQTDERGAVLVDATLRTTARRIFAVGDVTGGLAFTHVAAHHARVATLNALLGLRRRADTAPIPRVTFTDPEVARVGMSEAEARERWGSRVTIAAIDGHAQLDRPLTARAAQGPTILVGDPKGRLVGATIVGRAAGESIAELTAWISTGAKLDAVSTTVHAYPTYAEAAARAADEHLRARFATPRVRALLRPVLTVARHLPRRR